MVELSRTELGRRLKVGFELVGGELAEGEMPPFGIRIGEVVTDFQPRFGEIAGATTIE